MRCIRLVIVSTVVPHGIARRRRCFHDALAHTAKDGSFLCVRECSCHLGSLSGTSGEVRCIVKCACTGAAGHLIPLAAIRCRNNGMGCIWLFKLRSVVHLQCGFLSVCSNGGGTDLPAGYLCAGQRLAVQMRHIIAETAVCDLSTNAAGYIRCSGSYGRNGFSCKGRAVSGSNSAKGSSHKTNRSSCAHAYTSIHDCIPYIGITLKPACKARRKSCGRASCCSGSACASEHTSCAPGSTADAGDHSCGHQKLHTHAGTGLRHVEAHCGKIAVKFLCSLQESQCTEQPQEHAALSCGKGASIADVLSHRGVKATKEPYIHHQEQ